MKISSVVDCLLIAGACAQGEGLGSLEEQEELSGDLKCIIPLSFIIISTLPLTILNSIHFFQVSFILELYYFSKCLVSKGTTLSTQADQ